MADDDKFLDPIVGVAESQPAASAPEPKPEAPIAADEPAKVDPANSPDRPDGYVPQAALRETREELKRIREERDRERATFQKFLDRYHAETEPKPAPEENEPDADGWTGDPNDYLGKIEWLEQQIRADKVARRENEKQARQRAEQEAALSTANYAITTRWQTALKQRPELQQADDALAASYRAELETLGYSGPRLDAELKRMAQQHAAYCFQNQIPIEDYIEKLARARGWQGKAAQASQDPAEDRKPVAESQAPRDASGRFVSPDKIAEAQDRNLSLSQAPGVPVRKMTPQEFAKLSEEEQWRMFGKSRSARRDLDRELNFS